MLLLFLCVISSSFSSLSSKSIFFFSSSLFHVHSKLCVRHFHVLVQCCLLIHFVFVFLRSSFLFPFRFVCVAYFSFFSPFFVFISYHSVHIWRSCYFFFFFWLVEIPASSVLFGVILLYTTLFYSSPSIGTYFRIFRYYMYQNDCNTTIITWNYNCRDLVSSQFHCKYTSMFSLSLYSEWFTIQSIDKLTNERIIFENDYLIA